MTDSQNDKQILDAIHINIHAVRLLPNYKASLFEQKVGLLISSKYAPECKECHDAKERLNNPNNNKPDSFMDRIGGMFK